MADTSNVAPVLEHGADACEKVADAIREVAKAANRLVNGSGLSRRAIALLIRDTLPRGSKMDAGEILEVLDAAGRLERLYVVKGGAK